MHRGTFAILLLALVLFGCGDENVLERNRSFTGLWRADLSVGITYLLEFEEIGDSLRGSLYTESTTGERSLPTPILEGFVAEDAIRFTVDYEGYEMNGEPLDTLVYRGTLATENVIDMEQYFCFVFVQDSLPPVDTCLTIPFRAVREPSGL